MGKLSHEFGDDPEQCGVGSLTGDSSDHPCLRCIRCGYWVRPNQVNDLCPKS